MKYLFGFLALLLVGVWLAVFQLPDSNLHLIACDVGEGDAILAIYGDTQILTDAGPNNRVLDCLARHIPFWDKEIEVVVLTHPDKDHYGGLAELFKSYQVDNFLINRQSVYTETRSAGTEQSEVLKGPAGGTKIIGAGTKVRAGKISLDILWPEDLLPDKSDQSNESSIISLLSFGSFAALLTADMPSSVSDRLVPRLALGIDYLKVPHHGSKNGLTASLLEVMKPKVAVISVGKNSYGHPAEETLKILRDNDIKILRTDEVGDIEVVSDGMKFWLIK